MRKTTFLTVTAFAVAALLAGGTLLASNMGFKLNLPLLAADGVNSKSGTSSLALPFNRQSGLNTAKNLMDDIGFANVANVQRFLEASDALQVYTGRKGTPGADFPLQTAEGYLVRMSATVNYIVVGSHDPSFVVDLNAADGVTSRSGTNFYAYPYHSTASTAKQLMDEIGFANVANVQKFLKASDALQVYTGRKGTPGSDFSLAAGEAYFIRMSGTVAYVPSHF